MDGSIYQEEVKALLFTDNLLTNLVLTIDTVHIMQIIHVDRLLLTPQIHL